MKANAICAECATMWFDPTLPPSALLIVATCDACLAAVVVTLTADVARRLAVRRN